MASVKWILIFVAIILSEGNCSKVGTYPAAVVPATRYGQLVLPGPVPYPPLPLPLAPPPPPLLPLPPPLGVPVVLNPQPTVVTQNAQAQVVVNPSGPTGSNNGPSSNPTVATQQVQLQNSSPQLNRPVNVINSPGSVTVQQLGPPPLTVVEQLSPLAPLPVLAPYPVPGPLPVPVPGPLPVPVLGPLPVPVPGPLPVPVPGPLPVPVPGPYPVLVPRPYPVPLPGPLPLPAPYPVPLPGPLPLPAPYPVPLPGPLPVPAPYPVPLPGPLPVLPPPGLVTVYDDGSWKPQLEYGVPV